MSEMRIQLELQGLTQARQAFNQLAADINRMAAANQRLGLSAQGAAGQISVPRVPRTTSGPASRLQQAQEQLQAAQASGDRVRLFDAQIGLMRAQRSLERAQRMVNGPDTMQRIESLIRTTRIGNGGAQPLIGRIADVVAPMLGSMLGGAKGVLVGMIIALLIKPLANAVEGLVRAMKAAADSFRQHSEAMLISGGTSRNVAFLRTIGVQPDSLAGTAAALRDRLANDPSAMITAARLGMGPTLPREFGPRNEAAILENTLRHIAALESAEKRLAATRSLGLESLLPNIEALRRHSKALEADAQAMAKVNDKASMEAAEDLNTNATRLRNNLDMLRNAVFKPFIKAMADFTGFLASTIRNITLLINDYNTRMMKIRALQWDTIKNPLNVGKNLRAAWDELARPIDLKVNDVMDRHTQAMEAHTAALKQGTYGGGDRARSAIPAGLRGYYFEQAIAGNSLRLGAFSL